MKEARRKRSKRGRRTHATAAPRHRDVEDGADADYGGNADQQLIAHAAGRRHEGCGPGSVNSTQLPKDLTTSVFVAWIA